MCIHLPIYTLVNGIDTVLFYEYYNAQIISYTRTLSKFVSSVDLVVAMIGFFIYNCIYVVESKQRYLYIIYYLYMSVYVVNGDNFI